MKKIVIVTGILTLTSSLGYYFHTKSSRKLTLVEKSEFLQEFATEVGKAWRNADVRGDSICKSLKTVDNSYYQCRPTYLRCLIENDLLNIFFKKQKVSTMLRASLKNETYSTHLEYMFPLKINKKYNLDLRLKDSCKEAYLPQRYYPFMANQRSVTIEWDTFNKNIFVDKNLIRNEDILNWAKRTNKRNLVTHFKDLSKQEVATNLKISQMEEFCSSQGKHILSARVSDAMALHPEDITAPNEKFFRAPYFPWSRRNSETKIFKLQKNLDVEITDKDRERLCNRVYSKECINHGFIHYNSMSVTWMGAREVMGGVFEYVTNAIHPRENINLSSKYYPWKSKAHRVGTRGYWDGEGFSSNNFELGKYPFENFPNNIEIGFRCMRFK
jgi:hypothetical protein